eukprot:gnl/Dysnectes_brevis/2482_a2965_854.p1 GENE.gnl/Dysnectes_brevis/2482_a2965_854~~gnl/Dysnectes_brevis/2482_a2965_854.p1  ORF type:complete len:346 (+),score=74.76 gnl/Dysnectes_brevis/2482_a2965_854:35-1039(+)
MAAKEEQVIEEATTPQFEFTFGVFNGNIEDSDLDIQYSQVGGRACLPTSLPALEHPVCSVCERKLSLLCQTYAPIERDDVLIRRVIYLFGCNSDHFTQSATSYVATLEHAAHTPAPKPAPAPAPAPLGQGWLDSDDESEEEEEEEKAPNAADAPSESPFAYRLAPTGDHVLPAGDVSLQDGSQDVRDAVVASEQEKATGLPVPPPVVAVMRGHPSLVMLHTLDGPALLPDGLVPAGHSCACGRECRPEVQVLSPLVWLLNLEEHARGNGHAEWRGLVVYTCPKCSCVAGWHSNGVEVFGEDPETLQAIKATKKRKGKTSKAALKRDKKKQKRAK